MDLKKLFIAIFFSGCASSAFSFNTYNSYIAVDNTKGVERAKIYCIEADGERPWEHITEIGQSENINLTKDYYGNGEYDSKALSDEGTNVSCTVDGVDDSDNVVRRLFEFSYRLTGNCTHYGRDEFYQEQPPVIVSVEPNTGPLTYCYGTHDHEMFFYINSDGTFSKDISVEGAADAADIFFQYGADLGYQVQADFFGAIESGLEASYPFDVTVSESDADNFTINISGEPNSNYCTTYNTDNSGYQNSAGWPENYCDPDVAGDCS